MKNASLITFILLLAVAGGAIYLEYKTESNKVFSVASFKPITNYRFADNSKLFNVDLTHAIDSGIIAPVKGQTATGYFTFTTIIKANKAGSYFYKLYYQNESYKMPEWNKEGYDTLAAENFYGSWEDTLTGFKEFKAPAPGLYTITDSFRIAGNPRNEHKFYGKPTMEITETDIANMINYIRQEPQWMDYIHATMEKKKITEMEAMRADAIWALREQRHKGPTNHRWKRNPRMGNYSAMLVVADEAGYKSLPGYIVDITKKSPKGYFVNPYYYFKKELKGENVEVNTVENFIRLKATMTPERGVYVDQYDYTGIPDSTYYSDQCGCRTNLFHKADFEQFFHAVNKDFVLNTVPVIADVENDGFTRDDYYAAEKKYKPHDMLVNYIRITDSPCKTVLNKGRYIEIRNPASSNLATARKENVGVKTRHGFSYGKVTAKIKFPRLINKTNVWTGITQAVWLLFQDKEAWNNRRNSVKGYTPKGSHTADAPRIPTTNYTEIDFEIVKTSKYWPDGLYPPKWRKTENAQLNDDITVTTTNWDLANPDPKKYAGGVMRIPYKNRYFEAARWDNYYQALTTRTAVKQSKIAEREFYYYQIEWRPKEIIWRIGPDKDHLFVVGYMNDEYTSIPNNQMILVITQEYHLSDWWPPIPFKQEYIPYPKNDLVGKVYEVEVE